MIQAFAPPYLLQELDDEHLSRYQPAKKPIPFSHIQEAKRLLLPSIRFVEPPEVSSPAIEKLRARDLKDVKYAQLFEHLKLDAVLTRDPDWEVTGYPIVKADDHDLIKTLRDYSRAAAEELGRLSTLTAGAAVTFAVVQGAWELFRRAHPAVQVLVGGTLVLAAISPETHQGIEDAVLQPFLDFYKQLQKKSQERSEAEQLIARDICPNPHRLTLKEHVQRVLRKAGKPLELSELEQRVRAAGAKTRSKNIRAYFRKLMANDRNFVEYTDGRWELREPLTWPLLSSIVGVKAPNSAAIPR
jgi:hypothetical protein